MNGVQPDMEPLMSESSLSCWPLVFRRSWELHLFHHFDDFWVVRLSVLWAASVRREDYAKSYAIVSLDNHKLDLSRPRNPSLSKSLPVQRFWRNYRKTQPFPEGLEIRCSILLSYTPGTPFDDSHGILASQTRAYRCLPLYLPL
jgi:hypothetical protein